MNVDTKTISWMALGLALVAALGVFGGGMNREIVISNDTYDQKTITVSGEAERFVAPDTARISFSMTRKNVNLSVATDSVNERIGEMVDALSEFGVKDKDMKTTNYNVYPEYNYVRNSGERTFDGYRVNQSIELKIRDLDQVSPILTKIASFEVDNVSGLSFYVEDDQDIRDELRKEAIDSAKAKAAELSRDLGVSLKTIVGFNEGGQGYYPQPVYAAAMDFEESSFAVREATVPAGENAYNAQVSITFVIE